MFEFLDEPIPITSQQWREGTIPIVSISCITYNHENFIRDAIEGFLMQRTTFPVEILIHDDASTDKTAEIVREYEKKYPQLIKPIYQTENQYSKGIGVSTTFQFPRAHGKYIALCEGDDYWTDPLKLQKQVDFLEENPDCSLVCHNISDKVDDILYPRPIVKENRYLTNEEIILARGMMTSTLSLGFRKKYVEYLPKWVVTSPVGDIPLVLYIMTQGNVFCFRDIMGVYRKNLSTSWSNKKRNLYERFKFALSYNFFLQSFNKFTKYKYDKEIFVHTRMSPIKYNVYKTLTKMFFNL
jgi:glycosyltransferase involved in cell wall biosynthesis